jgi:TPR repeat protein
METVLDSIQALRRNGKLPTEGVSLALRSSSWRESSAEAGERWLRERVQADDPFAMELLSLRLIEGDGVARSVQEGEFWLERSAQCGNPAAIQMLSDRRTLNADPQTSLDDPSTLVTAASRLIEGGSAERGQQLLRNAADRGMVLAHVRLATLLMSGAGLPRDQQTALRYLRRLGVTSGIQVGLLGVHTYLKSLAAYGSQRRRLAEDAAILFEESARQGCRDTEVSLAYLLRRGEVSALGRPTLDDLLAWHLENGSSEARINEALRLAAGVECKVDWVAADARFAGLNDVDGVFSWWHDRSAEGDAEGHLVIGWFVRHGYRRDPDGLSLTERLDQARTRGWSVPPWMNNPVG